MFLEQLVKKIMPQFKSVCVALNVLLAYCILNRISVPSSSRRNSELSVSELQFIEQWGARREVPFLKFCFALLRR